MNIYILSVSPEIYSTNRIVQEAKRLKHNVRVINYLKCTIRIHNGKQEIIYNGEDILGKPAVIIPRIGASATQYGSSIVKAFELKSVFTTASSSGIVTSQNKARTLQVISAKGIPVPNSVFSVNTENVEEQIQLLGGAPIIIKLQEGTQGVGVMLAETNSSAISIIDTMYNINKSILLQEFIKESNGEDIRVFVVGDRIVAAMKRKGLKDDFRSNIHKGGKGLKVSLTEQEQEIAIKAVQHLNLKVAGVDLIRSKRGSLLIEVNSTPGLQGIETYTKVNVAKEIIKYIDQNVSRTV